MSNTVVKYTSPPVAYNAAPVIEKNPRRAFYITAYILFGILAIIGFALTYIATEKIPQLLGEALKYISTMGFTTLFAWFFAQSYAQRQFSSELSQIIQPLRTAATDVRHATFSPKNDTADYVHSMVRIGVSNDQMVAAIGSLERLCGGPGQDARVDINDRVRKLAAENEELKNALSTVNVTLERIDDKKAAIVELQRNVGAVLRKTLVRENVECPFCNKLTPTYIGENQNDGATPVCINCASKFHAHRRPDYIEGVKPGGFQQIRMEVPCGQCRKTIPLNVGIDDRKIQARFCGECGSKNMIDPSTRLSASAEPRQIIAGVIRSDGAACCKDCNCGGELLYKFVRPDGSVNGVCVNKDALVRCR
jgi:hypothetical protein